MIYFIVEIFIVCAVIGIDQWTKFAAVSFLQNKPFNQHSFIDGFLELRYIENTGASWGIFKDKTIALIIFTAIALALLIVVLVVRAKKEKKMLRIPLLLILAGGIGNLIDRIAFGYVRDFLNFTFFDFPVFNLADSAISIGAFLLVVYLIVEIINEGRNKDKPEDFEKEVAEKDNNTKESVEKEKNNIDDENIVKTNFDVENIEKNNFDDENIAKNNKPKD